MSRIAERLDKDQKILIFDACIAAVNKSLDAFTKTAKSHGISHKQLAEWSEELPAKFEDYEIAKTNRAMSYICDARKIIDDVEIYYTTKHGETRDSTAAVKKAQSQVDLRIRLAASLDPATWSDMRHEVKQIQKDLRELKASLDANNNTMFHVQQRM